MIKSAYSLLTGFSNLRGYCATGAYTGVNISFDSAVLRNAAGDTFVLGPTSGLTSSANVNALNGSDGATSAPVQFTYVYVISGPGKTPATVWSLSDVAPNLTGPAFAGYTFYALAMPIRQVSGGTIAAFNQLGDEIIYLNNTLSGQIINGSIGANSPTQMPNVAAYVPPRAFSWVPCGYYAGSYSVNQGGSFGAFTGTLQGGRNFADLGTVDFALVIQDSGSYTASCNDEIPQNVFPWYTGQTPWFSFTNANGLGMTILGSVRSYRYPNGA